MRSSHWNQRLIQNLDAFSDLSFRRALKADLNAHLKVFFVLIFLTLNPQESVAKSKKEVSSKSLVVATAATSTRPVHQKQKSRSSVKVAKQSLASSSTIRTYDEFMKLSVKEREMYLVGLEGIVNALQAEDPNPPTEYQTADARWDLLEALFPAAKADDASDRRCIYAGSVSEMDINGRYCMRPLNQGCAGKITCNPLVYGAKKCVAGGSQAKYASRNCARIAKPLATVVKEIEGKRDEWEKFRTELSGYCESPRPSQKGLCVTIKARVSRLEAILPSNSEAGPIIATEAQKLEIQSTPIAPPAANKLASDGSFSANGIKIKPVKQQAAAGDKGTLDEITVNSVSDSSALTGPGRICTRSFLLGDLRREDEETAYGTNLMSIGEAQDMMCFLKDSSSLVTEVRRFLRSRLSQISKLEPKYRANERAEIRQMSANFEACLKEANEIKAGKKYVDPYPNGGTLQIKGYDPSVPAFKQNPRNLSAVFWDDSGKSIGHAQVTHLGSWIDLKEISICKLAIQVRDINDPQERFVGSPASSDASSSGR